jgi:hypothetical protein
MPNQKFILVVICISLLFASCGSERGSKEGLKENITQKSAEVKTHTGGCILCESIGEVPEGLYQVTDVIETDEFPPFNKKITSMGITLLGSDDISDQFMRNVARTIQAMFDPEGEKIDQELQQEMIRNMYKYKATIPLYKGHDHEMSSEDQAKWAETRKKISACDIIMEAVPTQINEVVEHILHHVSDVGLHYTFPEEWGISNTSTIHMAVKDAIEKGYYKVEQYSDAADERHNRVLIQEYTYWIIFDVWELRETFFPRDAEFAVKTGADLKEKLPMSYDLVVETIPKVMVRPGDELLIELFGSE